MSNYINTLNPVTASVTIANKRVNPVSLVLTQAYGEHHYFEMTLDYDIYGDDFMSNPVKHIELIGRLVYIRFNNQGTDNTESYQFKGVVTGVKQTGKEGKKGYLVLSGSSPTIMLEKGKRMDIYSNRSLHQITKQISEKAYSDYITFGAEPVFKNKIDFLMQYNESDWDFLKRLAYLYRENLYYSGHELLFGYYPDLKTVHLTYDKEIIDLEFCSQMIPNNFERYQYVAENDSTIEREVPRTIDNSNDYLDTAEEMAYNAMNTQEHTKTYMDAPLYSNSEVSDILKRDKSRNATQSITIKGKSKTFKTTIGQAISISMPDILSKTSNIGTYRVIKSIHRIDEKNRYSCEFEAVPAEIEVMPIAEPKTLTAESVVAKVKSNEDPLNQGRVQVEFGFSSNYNRAWIRVLTPNAGSSETITQNRGMVFIPEKGDQVMIGFEHGDPNRPYVMGSLFHGKNGKGGGQNNAEKSIITRSGIQINFNDDSGSLHIEDPSGNVIDLDGKGNMELTAPKRFILNATDAEFNINNNLDVNVNNNYTSVIRNQQQNTIANLNQSVSNTMQLFSGRALLSSKEAIQLESNEINAIGTDKVFIHSDELFETHSKGDLNLYASRAMQATQSPTDAPERTDDIITDAVAVFMMENEENFDGGFGFDRMRAGNIKNSLVRPLNYKDTVTEMRRGNISLADPDKVYPYLQREYSPLKIRKGSSFPEDASRIERYCIPSLTMYPKNPTEWKAEAAEVRPPNKVKLKLLLTYKEKGIKTIVLKPEVGYEESIKINNPKFELNADLEITDDASALTNLSPFEVEITTEAGLEKDVYINAWAYREGQDQRMQGALAGRILVKQNYEKRRKNLKVLLINVEIINPNSGINTSTEKMALTILKLVGGQSCQRLLSQALIHTEIDIFDKTADNLYSLIDDDKFKKGGSYITDENLINMDVPTYAFDWTAVDTANATWEEILKSYNETMMKNYTAESGMLAYLETKFRDEYPDYADHILYFVFPIKCAGSNDSAAEIRKIGGRSIGHFSNPENVVQDNTIAHEVAHALGLAHTFRSIPEEVINLSDGTQFGLKIPLDSPQKFVFSNDTENNQESLIQSDNLMSYSSNKPYKLWQWQIDKMNSNLN